jgi:DNA-binding GntR family transcriptional regulator
LVSYGGTVAEHEPAGRRPTTRADAVYRRLRADILAGRRRPGERLKAPDLCADYTSSVGVLREALTRLAADGLVRAQPRQGFAVVTLSEPALRELTEARTEIEGIVFGRAVTEGDLAWESRVVAAHHTLQRTPVVDEEDGDHPGHLGAAWSAAHAQFHEALLAGCANTRLRGFAESLRSEAELYRQWSYALDGGSDGDLLAEHRALLDAALRRDRDTAVALLRAHINRSTEVLVRGLSDGGL